MTYLLALTAFRGCDVVAHAIRVEARDATHAAHKGHTVALMRWPRSQGYTAHHATVARDELTEVI